MHAIVDRVRHQRVALHVGGTWRIIGTIIEERDGVVELADEEGAPIFVNLSSIVAIEPSRARGGPVHDI
jgi:hypothetical protein